MECPIKNTKEFELVKEIQRLNKLVDELMNENKWYKKNYWKQREKEDATYWG